MLNSFQLFEQKDTSSFAHLEATLDKMGLPIINCNRFGSDSVSAIIGDHDSVLSRVKAKSFGMPAKQMYMSLSFLMH